MKKKYFATTKDKEDWTAFTKNFNNLYDKEANLQNLKINPNKFIKLDLHGFSLSEANKKVKKFIIESYNRGYKKLIIVTGKGLRSKTDNNPYASNEMNILKNSVPDYVLNEPDLSVVIKKVTKADIKHGGDGAIYIFLKNMSKL